MKQKNWTRDELLVCFNFYCRTPFGKLHQRNPEIIALSAALGRSPSAVAMKSVNFASFDASHRNRNVTGLRHASKADAQIWLEFSQEPNKLAIESEDSLARIVPFRETSQEIKIPDGPTESMMPRPMRLVQRFFRAAVLASYRFRCAFCGINILPLLCASHIIPWSKDINLRADPRNGFALCAMHDKAFDRGLMSVDEDNKILISSRLFVSSPPAIHKVSFQHLEGSKIGIPEKFSPYAASILYHRTNVFR